MADIFDDIKKMQEEMEALFRDLFHFKHPYALESPHSYGPLINVYYNDKNVVVILESAGVDKNSLTVDVSERLLTVRGERKDPFRKFSGNYYTVEINFGKFERWIHLPCPVEQDDIQMKIDNGLIKITLLRKKRQEKIIPIE